MNQFHERAGILLDSIIGDLDSIKISDKIKVTVRCLCGKENSIGARSLLRRWANKKYLCKSCSVKTYISDPDVISKRVASFKKNDTKTICSKNAKALWEKPEHEAARQRISKAVSEDNKDNPKKIEARRKAVEAFKTKHDIKQHLVRNFTRNN